MEEICLEHKHDKLVMKDLRNEILSLERCNEEKEERINELEGLIIEKDNEISDLKEMALERKLLVDELTEKEHRQNKECKKEDGDDPRRGLLESQRMESMLLLEEINDLQEMVEEEKRLLEKVKSEKEELKQQDCSATASC